MFLASLIGVFLGSLFAARFSYLFKSLWRRRRKGKEPGSDKVAELLSEAASDPRTVIAAISAALQAADIWTRSRDRRQAAEAYRKSYEVGLDDPEVEYQADVLALAIQDSVMQAIFLRMQRCSDGWTDVLLSDYEYLLHEVADAEDAFERCMCRELRRLKRLIESLPSGWMNDWWIRFRCDERGRGR